MRYVLLSLLSVLLMLPCSAQTSTDTLAVKSNFKLGEMVLLFLWWVQEP